MRMLFPDRVADYVYVENIAYAHMLAENQLRMGTAGVAGEAFSITNCVDAMTDTDFALAMKHMFPSLKITVLPKHLMRILAWFSGKWFYLSEHILTWSEIVQRVGKGRWSLGHMDLITPATLNLSCLTYTFTNTKAMKALGYSPLYSVDEGLQKSFAFAKAAAK